MTTPNLNIHVSVQEVKYFSYVDELPITSDDISKTTKTDPELAKVYDFVANGWLGFVPDEQMKPYYMRRAVFLAVGLYFVGNESSYSD